MPKLLYFISEDWFFCSHFLGRAKAARENGFDVVVLTQVTHHRRMIEEAGLRVLPLSMERSSMRLDKELRVLARVWRAYRLERPDLVHHIALKPIIYGTLIAWLFRIKAIVNAPVGMGYVFTAQGARGRFLRGLVLRVLRKLMNPRKSKVVFENEEDLAESVNAQCVKAADAVLIRGAGVDTSLFAPVPPPPGIHMIILGSRMLRDKGVIEFVEAAKLLRLRQIAARCVLVGAPDPANPSSLTRDQLEHWAAEGAVEWWGHRENMATTLQQFHIACLPSYREGLPKFLLEAMACGLPVVSTDVPGCREAVEPERTGRLVPPRDALALASALESLVVSEGARNRFGAAGRERVLRMFDQRLIIRETLDLYALMCPSLPRGEFQ